MNHINTTVIQGTQRAQDLTPAFMGALLEADPAAYAQIIINNPVPAYVQDEGDDSLWWGSSAAYQLLEGLFDALDAAAPDGSDYGFWEAEEHGNGTE